MATSGSVYTGYLKSSRFYVNWQQTGQSISGNYTDIKWQAGLHVSGGNLWYSNAIKITSLSIAGTSGGTGTWSNITSNGYHQLLSGTKRIYHNSDGSKSFTISIGGWLYGEGSTSGSESFSLSTIPRATTPTVSASSVTAGNAVTIRTPRASSSFTHTLTYAIDSASGTIATGVGTSYSWTVPLSLINQIATATSGNCTIACKTYNGSTLIGTKTVSLTIVVPSSIVPSIGSVSISEAVAAVTNAFGELYVQSLSQLNVSVSAAGAYGSTIKAYSSTVDGVNYIAKSFTSNIINTSGTISLVTKVTDSRGRTAQSTKSVTVVPYSPPEVTRMSYYQCDEDGTQNSAGTCTKVMMAGKISSVSDKNSMSLLLKYKPMSAETYTERTIEVSTWSFETSLIIENTDPTITYEYIAILTDKISSTENKILTGVPVISRRAGGKGVTLFKEAEADGFWVGNVDYTIYDSEYDELLKLLGGGS